MVGSPVVLVLSGVLSSFPVGSTFRQVEITVTGQVEGGSDSRSYLFLVDVGGDELRVDIASALRSMLFDVGYDAAWLDRDVINYPSVTFRVDYRTKYMVDGEIYYGESQLYNSGCRAVPGRISEMDRLRINGHVADYYNLLRFTTKPSDGIEIVPVGENVVTHSIGQFSGVVGKTYTVDAAGVHTLADGRKVYGVVDDGTLFSLRFVNSMGVLDTATAICKEALSYSVQTEGYNLTTAPSNRLPSGMEALKRGGRGKLTMSSGFVSRQWADWWAEEVMRTTKCWIKFGNQYITTGDVVTVLPLWLPCILTPKDEEITVYDRSSLGLCSVEFKAEISLEGSLLRTVIS